jgi:hypothetical protein
MQTAYRVIQRLQGHRVTIELPADFPECSAIDIIVLPHAQSQEAPPLTTENWLASVWGSAPDFPDRPEQPPLKAIDPL